MKKIREELTKKMLESTGKEQEDWAMLLDYNTSRNFRKTMSIKNIKEDNQK